MQKLLALLMLATVLLSVSACGDRPDDQAEQFPPTVYDDIAGGSPAPDNNSAGDAPIPSEQLRGSEKHDIPATPYDEMVENGRDCSEVLIQLAAVRSALDNTGKVILKDHMRHCMVDAVAAGDQDAIDDLCQAIDKFMK